MLIALQLVHDQHTQQLVHDQHTQQLVHDQHTQQTINAYVVVRGLMYQHLEACIHYQLVAIHAAPRIAH
jgi:hypothetical protein